MAMTLVTEANRAGEFLLSEAPGAFSRESVTITGGSFVAGAVLGKIVTGTAAAVAGAGNTGDGTMGTITVSGSAKSGVYTLTVLDPVTNAGAFSVEDPDGIVIGVGDIAAAFSAGGLAFTLADGATDFLAGDTFAITVTVTATKYTEYDMDATDGSQVACAVLWDAVDASAADATGVIIDGGAEVSAARLTWITGIDAGEITAALAQLKSVGIKAR